MKSEEKDELDMRETENSERCTTGWKTPIKKGIKGSEKEMRKLNRRTRVNRGKGGEKYVVDETS